MKLHDAISAMYDRWFFHPVHDEFHGPAYSNFGYWARGAADAEQASLALVQEVTAPAGDVRGRVLDAGCGKGGTTAALAALWPHAQVVGINIAPTQLASCRQQRGALGFARMDAAQLGFADASFDAVVSIEAAFHFGTRSRFLREALRVLRPGGRLLIADVLWKRWIHRRSSVLPLANHLPGLGSYAALCQELGFRDAVVRDVTADTYRAYRWNGLRVMPRRALRRGDLAFAAGFPLWILFVNCTLTNYALVSARRP